MQVVNNPFNLYKLSAIFNQDDRVTYPWAECGCGQKDWSFISSKSVPGIIK